MLSQLGERKRKSELRIAAVELAAACLPFCILYKLRPRSKQLAILYIRARGKRERDRKKRWEGKNKTRQELL